MDGQHFVTVFDAGQTGFRDWQFPAFGLIFVAAGIAIFFFPRIVRALKIPFYGFDSWRLKFFRYAFPAFGLFWTVMAFTATYLPYRHHLAMIQNNQCRTVEGAVENFRPMPYEGHGLETFTVNGVGFSYSDYDATDAFNNTASHGGPIRAGQIVRICYDPDGDAILRLAIRDFKGALPDYSKGEMDFSPPTRPARDDGAPDVPWGASVFVYLYALDFLGRFLLLRPYLRVFLRMSQAPVTDGALPAALTDGVKIKLANTLARWDQADATLWLRPRGLNFVQLSLMVAKFDTDPAGLRITGREVRFSTGFIAVMIAFFAGAYTMFSRVAQGAPAPLILLGVFAVFATFGMVRNVRRQAAQMGVLAEAALAELKAARAPSGP